MTQLRPCDTARVMRMKPGRRWLEAHYRREPTGDFTFFNNAYKALRGLRLERAWAEAVPQDLKRAA